MDKPRTTTQHPPAAPPPAPNKADTDRNIKTLSMTIAAEKKNGIISPAPTPDPNRLVRLPEVLTILPIKKSTWWLWCKLGKAPAPVRLGRCTCWKYADVVALATEGINHG